MLIQDSFVIIQNWKQTKGQSTEKGLNNGKMINRKHSNKQEQTSDTYSHTNISHNKYAE